jgi:hypothetical protein
MNSERKVKYMSDQLSILSEAPIWPEKVVTGWRRFSSGLWRVPEGDIQAAYCADTFPKVKVFTHDGHPFANCGGHFSGPIAAGADCYPLILSSDYRGPEPRRYSYEGLEAHYQGRKYKLGPKVLFAATDATVDEWRRLFRVQYADGGWFARQATYGLFLAEDHSASKSENAAEALKRELAGDLRGHSKEEMGHVLDETPTVRPMVHQLDLIL